MKMVLYLQKIFFFVFQLKKIQQAVFKYLEGNLVSFIIEHIT